MDALGKSGPSQDSCSARNKNRVPRNAPVMLSNAVSTTMPKNTSVTRHAGSGVESVLASRSNSLLLNCLMIAFVPRRHCLQQTCSPSCCACLRSCKMRPSVFQQWADSALLWNREHPTGSDTHNITSRLLHEHPLLPDLPCAWLLLVSCALP